MPDADGGADWMDKLLGRAKTDPGAPFEQHALHRLADLRRSRPDISERLRARFRDETRVRISSLDKALTALANDESGIVRQGLPLEWTEDEPWPEKVIGEELLGNVSALIARYVDIPKTRADAVALWIATTWIHDRLELSTFLNLTSATKRCGKSLLMEVIGALVFRPLPVSGRITPAALFRSIQRAEPTLLLDEADTYMTSDPELRVRPETLCRITEFSEHESNGRELDEGERVAVEVLPVLGQSAAAVEPGDGAFDHPTPGLDDEALHPIGSLDDLGLEIGQDAGQGAVKDRPLIGAVGEQFPEKGKQTEQGRQQRETAVAILNVGGGDDAVQQQALRIDQNMPLLALDQLAGIEAVAVDASPPFSALFTL